VFVNKLGRDKGAFNQMIQKEKKDTERDERSLPGDSESVTCTKSEDQDHRQCRPWVYQGFGNIKIVKESEPGMDWIKKKAYIEDYDSRFR
jgi:hypothetical protein